VMGSGAGSGFVTVADALIGVRSAVACRRGVEAAVLQSDRWIDPHGRRLVSINVGHPPVRDLVVVYPRPDRDDVVAAL